jgi:hypothetical protein
MRPCPDCGSTVPVHRRPYQVGAFPALPLHAEHQLADERLTELIEVMDAGGPAAVRVELPLGRVQVHPHHIQQFRHSGVSTSLQSDSACCPANCEILGVARAVKVCGHIFDYRISA